MSQRTLTALGLAIVMIGVLEFKQVHDTDIFWQVRLGQIMLNEGRDPARGSVHLHPRRRAGAPDRLAGPALVRVALQPWRLAPGASSSSRRPGRLVVDGRSDMPARCDVTASAWPSRSRSRFLVMLSNADLRPQSLGLLGFAALLAMARSRMSLQDQAGRGDTARRRLAEHASFGRGGRGGPGWLGGG